jgi:hypothetical protein
VNVALGTSVDDFHSVVAECGYEYSALRIEPEVVDATLHIRQGYRSRQNQRTLIARFLLRIRAADETD